ncbi:unnamed protein product, partial [Symbiodinium necroappetens]
GSAEKAFLLHFLTSPDTGGAVDVAVASIRKIASFKLERQLDYKAKASDVEDYAQLILGELEAALLAQPIAQQPKLNRMEETNLNDAGDKGKGKGKGKSKQPCWSWNDGSGCKYAQNCMFRHDPLGPGHCWTCGSSSHLKPQCPTTGKGGELRRRLQLEIRK